MLFNEAHFLYNSFITQKKKIQKPSNLISTKKTPEKWNIFAGKREGRWQRCNSAMNFRDGKKSPLKHQNKRVFTSLKRKPSFAGCWLTFPEFPWQLSLFFSKSPPSPMVFSQDCILFAVCSSLTINHVEVKRWGWTVAWVLLHMHSDPPQCILPKETQEGSGERRCCKQDKRYRTSGFFKTGLPEDLLFLNEIICYIGAFSMSLCAFCSRHEGVINLTRPWKKH